MAKTASKKVVKKKEPKQESEKVGYLGPNTPNGADRTTFGFMAAAQFFGDRPEIEYANYATHRAICEAVASQEIAYGVIAIENSIDGFVAESMRALEDAEIYGGVKVSAEVLVPIELYYLRRPRATGKPRAVISHPVALAQCDQFVQTLKEQDISIETRGSTGEAAYEASQDGSLAAVASARAEAEYGLQCLKPWSVTNISSSRTRFWVIGKQHARRTDKDKKYKTVMLIALNQPQQGALLRTLACFQAEEGDGGSFKISTDNNCPNLAVVYPVPILGRYCEYNFVLEFYGHLTDESIRAGLRRFASSGLSDMRPLIFGSYPDITSSH